VPYGVADQGGGNALPLMVAGDLGIKKEGMIASVPGHVDKAGQAAAGRRAVTQPRLWGRIWSHHPGTARTEHQFPVDRSA